MKLSITIACTIFTNKQIIYKHINKSSSIQSQLIKDPSQVSFYQVPLHIHKMELKEFLNSNNL